MIKKEHLADTLIFLGLAVNVVVIAAIVVFYFTR
jgi:hypothetical protein